MTHRTRDATRLLVWRGRTSRRGFWLATLVGFVGFTAANALDPAVGAATLLVLAVPATVLAVRRLHDVGRSGWHLLWGLVPYVGPVVVVVVLAWTGQSRPNRFGPPPAPVDGDRRTLRRATVRPVSPVPPPPPAVPVRRPVAPAAAPSLAELRAVLPPRSTVSPPTVVADERSRVPQAPRRLDDPGDGHRRRDDTA